MDEKDNKLIHKIFNGLFYFFVILFIIALFAFYSSGNLGLWYSQNWVLVAIAVTVVVAVSFVLYFISLFFGEIKDEDRKNEGTNHGTMDILKMENEKLDKEIELKKAIIRKKILNEKSRKLDSLNLTDEEREYQIGDWVEKEYTNGTSDKYTSSSENQMESEFAKNPPLAQREKEMMINKVGTRCCYPNCGETAYLEVHHIISESVGGTNQESNLIVLCNSHHILADRGAIPRERLKPYSVAEMKEVNF